MLPIPATIRLSLFYAAIFAVIGIHLPFWPLWLASRGLSAFEIGVVTAVGIGAKVLTSPIIAHIADRRGERRALMIGLSFGALVAFALFARANSLHAVLVVTVLFFACWSALMPLAESLTMLTARAQGLDYGRVRLWGSLSFIVAAVLAGWAATARPADIVFWMLLACAAAGAGSSILLPNLKAPRAALPRFTFAQVVKDRPFLLFLAAATLIQGSHGVYYAFGTLHWRSVGHSETTIGWLWAEGVIAEIALFALGNALVRRIGPIRLLLLGGVAGAIRWTVTGLSDALPALLLVQILHAFTFGAAHLGAIHFMARRIEPGLSATAQSVYAAVVGGLGMGLIVLASGRLYESFGGGAYHAMAALGLAGGLLAAALARRTR